MVQMIVSSVDNFIEVTLFTVAQAATETTNTYKLKGKKHAHRSGD